MEDTICALKRPLDEGGSCIDLPPAKRAADGAQGGTPDAQGSASNSMAAKSVAAASASLEKSHGNAKSKGKAKAAAAVPPQPATTASKEQETSAKAGKRKPPSCEAAAGPSTAAPAPPPARSRGKGSFGKGVANEAAVAMIGGGGGKAVAEKPPPITEAAALAASAALAGSCARRLTRGVVPALKAELVNQMASAPTAPMEGWHQKDGDDDSMAHITTWEGWESRLKEERVPSYVIEDLWKLIQSLVDEISQQAMQPPAMARTLGLPDSALELPDTAPPSSALAPTALAAPVTAPVASNALCSFCTAPVTAPETPSAEWKDGVVAGAPEPAAAPCAAPPASVLQLAAAALPLPPVPPPVLPAAAATAAAAAAAAEAAAAPCEPSHCASATGMAFLHVPSMAVERSANGHASSGCMQPAGTEGANGSVRLPPGCMQPDAYDLSERLRRLLPLAQKSLSFGQLYYLLLGTLVGHKNRVAPHTIVPDGPLTKQALISANLAHHAYSMAATVHRRLDEAFLEQVR